MSEFVQVVKITSVNDMEWSETLVFTESANERLIRDTARVLANDYFGEIDDDEYQLEIITLPVLS